MTTVSKQALQVLLFTLLFAMQGLCHAHQIDHLLAGDNSPCTVCSAGGQLEDAATGQYSCEVAAPPDQDPSPAPLVVLQARQAEYHQARAPPLSR